MADEQDTTQQAATTTAPATPPAEQTQERLFTQVELGRLISAARKEAREAALKERPEQQRSASAPQAPVQDAQGQSSQQPSASDAMNAIENLRLENRFKDAVADLGLSRKLRNFLQAQCLLARPPNVDEWLADAMDALPVAQPRDAAPLTPTPAPTGTTVSSPTQQSTAPTGPPASDRGGVAPPSDGERFSNPLRWSEQDVARVLGEKEGAVAGARHLRDVFMAGLRGVTIEMPRRR